MSRESFAAPGAQRGDLSAGAARLAKRTRLPAALAMGHSIGFFSPAAAIAPAYSVRPGLPAPAVFAETKAVLEPFSAVQTVASFLPILSDTAPNLGEFAYY
ncbi:MAG: hypothetical protein PSV22_10375 [Pseudolabrys sp.]|nr:hypothetical protein [Pseudolabrys sp.]